jgi:LPS sulfotransferase NodH
MVVDKETKFLILSSQRSGSAWLISLLNKLGNTTAYGELLLRRRRGAGGGDWDSAFAYPRFIETQPGGLAIRPFSVFSYLDVIYRRPGVVGFKLMYWQLWSYPEVLAYLVRHHIRVVHLVRRNHLDVLISGAMKARTGQAHLLAGQPRPDGTRIELDPGTLVYRLKKLRRNILVARKLLRCCRLPHVEVAYEDLLRDQSHFSLIIDFLSINTDGCAPSSDLLRIRRGGHADVISNYDEVKEALAGSAFAELIQ